MTVALKGLSVLIAVAIASTGLLIEPVTARQSTPVATAGSSRPTLSESWKDFQRGHIEIQFAVDVNGLLDRTQESRNALLASLERVLVPFDGCQIEYGEVAVGVDDNRTTSYDLASLIEGLIVMEFPDFQAERRLSPVGSSLRSTYFIPYGKVSLKLRFDDGCTAAVYPSTPVASDGPVSGARAT